MFKHFVASWPSHPVVLTGDGIAVGAALGSFYGSLPEIAAAMSIIWVGVQMLMLAAKGVMWLLHKDHTKVELPED